MPQKLNQVPLVSASGSAQPPFPGGWVLAIFDAIHTFAPAFASAHHLPGSRRTAVRIKSGEPISMPRYEQLKAQLVTLVSTLFPTPSSVSGAAVNYVDDYLILWHQSAEFYHHWASSFGFESEPAKVLARALLRDLVLRLAYLESCERALLGDALPADELRLLGLETPAQVYGLLIADRLRRDQISQEKLAENLGLYVKKLQRLKTGDRPSWPLLQSLWGVKENPRFLAGIGFLDVLLRELKQDEGAMWPELFDVAGLLFPTHRIALDSFEDGSLSLVAPGEPPSGQTNFANFIALGSRLLMHPGFETVWPKLPGALWRAHAYALQFARFDDLVRAYLRFSKQGDEAGLKLFFHNAEQSSGNCPYQWINEVRLAEMESPHGPGVASELSRV